MKKFAKILSIVLCLAMVVSFAAMAFADETKKQITSMDQLTSGKYIIVCSNNVSLGTLDTGATNPWVLTGESVWTITVEGSTVKLADANGKYIAPKGGNANGVKEGEYSWAVSCTDGLFTFAGQGEDTVRLASNGNSDNKFRAYKISTLEGAYAAEYASTFALYQVSDSYVPEVTTPETTAPVVTEPAATIKTEIVNEINAGDKVYIYYPNGNEAMSATADGKKLAGVAATIDGDFLMINEGAAELTVSVDENGYYTFVCGGLYLTSGETGNQLFLAEAASEYSLWELTAQEAGGYLIRNVNAAYNDVANQYLEYYSGFTTYGLKDTSNVAFYTFAFAKAVAEVEPPVTEPTEPETTAPEAPETTAPEAPETTAPEAPETTAPEAPETTAPEAPETTAPEAPETTAPEAPETTAPEAPETSAPETSVPTTTPVGPGEDADETGDSTHIVLAVCLMMASAAVVVLVQKKRAF